MTTLQPVLLATIFASVALVSRERPVTRPSIELLVGSYFEVSATDAELDLALEQLQAWGVIGANDNMFAVTEAGALVLSNCEMGAATQREWIEAVIQAVTERLPLGSNNSFKPNPLRGSA